jgi:hypothetical protein
MRSRIFFAGVTIFWLVMNYLLYRSLWGGHSGFAASVPLQTVWEKILTAPDNSSLDIYNGDQKIGFGRWGAGTVDSPLIGSKVLSAEYQPGRPAEKLTGYGLSFEGSAMIGGSNHVRFQTSLSLDTNQTWIDLRIHASVRPNTWSLLAVAAKQSVVVNGDDGNGVWNKTWSFSELENPQTWLGDFVDPAALGFLGLNRSLLDAKSAGPQWEAHEDRMNFGQSKLRVYRLDSSVLGQHIEVVVSRIGEILWVDLPFHISLRNQAITISRPEN